MTDSPQIPPNPLLSLFLTALVLIILAIVVTAWIYPATLTTLWHALSQIGKGTPLGSEYP